jgi:predicted RNase H-like HicB family nuclease
MSVMSAQAYFYLPWSIRGPVEIVDGEGNRHYEIRVSELPDFFVAGRTESEVLYAFKKALLAFLESYINEGEVPPHPKGEPVTYLFPLGPSANRGKVEVSRKGQTVGAAFLPSLVTST